MKSYYDHGILVHNNMAFDIQVKTICAASN